jgi:hypothetical protein
MEHEIAELRLANAHLRRRLEEAAMQADFRTRADRLLAIPLPDRR